MNWFCTPFFVIVATIPANSSKAFTVNYKACGESLPHRRFAIDAIEFVVNYRNNFAASQIEVLIRVVLLRCCGIVIVAHEKQPECKTHSTIDRSVKGAEE